MLCYLVGHCQLTFSTWMEGKIWFYLYCRFLNMKSDPYMFLYLCFILLRQ